ncbi:MAG TPA: glycosyltransferase family 4 protein [Puia sp.]|nr:glycosyltransferase family 4 protein [Puia sp.]
MGTVISLVSYPFLPAKVGGQRGIALFYKYFSRWQPVVCVTTEKNDPSFAEGYEVLNILSNSTLRYINFFYLFRLRRIIRERGATHLILEHPYYGWLGVLLKWVCGVKLVVHSHNLEGLRWKTFGKWWWRILWMYERWVHRRANYNFFIQEEDMQYALDKWRLNPARCIVMTYGFEKETIPSPAEMEASRKWLREKYGIGKEETILFFNGAFNYQPNLEALEYILKRINPILRKKTGFPYKILICGRDIPEAISGGGYPNVFFAGYVDDIDVYFRGSDVFLNPVITGGGIKTKLVEALGNNLAAVSVPNGAMGIDPAWCGGKLLISADGDRQADSTWEGFAELVVRAAALRGQGGGDVPPAFFAHFYWGYTTRRAAAFIG